MPPEEQRHRSTRLAARTREGRQKTMKAATIFLFLLFGNALHAQRKPAPDAPSTPPQSRSSVLASLSTLPAVFEPNRGQVDSAVRFLARSSGYTLFLTDREAVFAPPEGTPVRMRLSGARPPKSAEGLEPTGGVSNYFLGNDPAKWRSNIPHYRKVRYRGVTAGVDQVFYVDRGGIEYDLVVAPGTDASQITMEYEGARSLDVDALGDLVLATDTGAVRLRRPTVYQTDRAGNRVPVEASFRLKDAKHASFLISRYDPHRELVIDPVVTYATYLGGSSADTIVGMALDSSGNTYLTGATSSADFPTVNPFQSTIPNNSAAHVFVTKLNPTGTALAYSTFIGGSSGEAGYAIAIDPPGNAYITGITSSSNFPIQNALQPAFQGQGAPVFATKLDPTGSRLVYSTFLGNSGTASGIAADPSGNAYVVGATLASGFPTKSPLQSAPAGANVSAPFISKISPDGSAFIYSTFLSANPDTIAGVAADVAGNAYLAGVTFIYNKWPLQAPLQPTIKGYSNAFVSKINPTGSALVYSTYLGGTGSDTGMAIAIDASGNAYVAGTAQSRDFPTKNALYPSPFGGGSGFLSEINPSGSALVFSTYAGAPVNAVAVDPSNNVYIAGSTALPTYPIQNAIQATPAGTSAFVTAFAPGGNSLLYSTFIGGNNRGFAIAADASGNAYLAGTAYSASLPAGSTPPFQSKIKGSFSGYVVKLSPTTAVVGTVNAASFAVGAPIALNSIASAFGSHLGTQSVSASGALTTTLGGTTVNLTDVNQTTVAASLFYVGTGQVNFLVPTNLAPGLGQIEITAGDGTRSVGPLQIANVAPGIFTADGTLAVGQAQQVDAQGNQTFLNLANYDTTSEKFTTTPVSLGPSTTSTYLILYGTGIRAAPISQISMTMNGLTVTPAFAGIQGTFAGLDQINVLIPHSLAGAGDVAITLTAAGSTSNTVHVNVQ